MDKKRMNLRKVATIVACLAVTTDFFSCENVKLYRSYAVERGE